MDCLILGLKMKLIPSVFLAIFCLAPTGAAQFRPECIPASQSAETIPTLRASQILPPEIIKTNSWIIREQVDSDGFLNSYSLVSGEKEYIENGTSLLSIRLGELDALRQLKDYTSSEAFINAAAKSGLAVVTAPVRAVRSVAEAAIDPEGTWDTLKKVPSGIEGLFDHIGKQISTYWGKSKRAVAGPSESVKKKNREEILGSAKTQSVDYAAKWSGYSSSEKDWFNRLEIDPYTDNAELLEEIKRVAGIESGVSIAFKFVPGIGGIAYLGDINRGLSYSRSLAVYADPEELRSRNRKALIELKLPSSCIETLLKCESISPSLQTAATQLLSKLKGVPGLDKLVCKIGAAETVEQAFFLIESARYLGLYHRAVKPLQELLDGFVVSSGLTNDGIVIVPLPLDHVSLTKSFAKRWCEFTRVLRHEKKTKSVELRFRSTVSQKLKSALDQRDVYVFENVGM